MKIRVWGTRGSLTTPGRETVRYGGFTTCVEVRLADGTLVVIDSGSGIHRLGSALLAEPGTSQLYLLLTHAHWDHLTGFPFFTPAYLERYRIHVRGGTDAKDPLRRYLEHQMDPPFFPVEFNVLRARFDFEGIEGRTLAIGSATVVPVPLSHPNGGTGYAFTEGGSRLVFLTDNELGRVHPGGLTAGDYRRFCEGADLALLDAEFTAEEYRQRAGWGHSTWEAALEMALGAGCGRLGLWHHNVRRTDEDLDRIVAECRGRISAAGSGLECFAARQEEALEVGEGAGVREIDSRRKR